MVNLGIRVTQSLLSALLGAVGIAQDRAADPTERVATAVTVLDASGQRIENANLMCFASPWCGDVRGVDDLVQATSDERGMAVLQLLPGRRYTVAAAKAIEQPNVRSSVEVDVLVAGAAHSICLRERKLFEARPLAGLEQWQAAGPLVVEVSPVMHGSFFVPIDQNPVLPVLRMRVLARDGGTIWQGAAVEALANGMPGPQSIAVRVQTAEREALAGAEIWQQVPARVRDSDWRAMPPTRGSWRLVGKTDKSGEATVRVALRVADGSVQEPLLLQARAHGRVPAQAGIDDRGTPFRGYKRRASRRAIKMPTDEVLRFWMEQPQELRIAPPAIYRVMVMGKSDLSAVAPIEEPITAETDDDGKAMLPLHVDAFATRVALIERSGQGPIWTLLEPGARGCEVSLASTTIAIEVQDREGNPARAAAVHMTPYNDAAGFLGFHVPVPVDAAGRTRLQLNTGANWLLWSRMGDDLAWQVIPARPAKAIRLVLQLQPMPRGKLRFLDAQGEPAVGLRVIANGRAVWQRPSSPEHHFLSFLQRELEQQLRPVATTNAAGELWLPLLPLPGATLPLTLRILSTGQKHAVVLQPGKTADVQLR